MNLKRFVIASIGAFFFVFIYEFLLHGVLMMDLYNQTSEVWRPQEEANMAIMFVSQLLFAIALAFFYPVVGMDDEQCKKGIPFGLGLGLVMAMPQIGSYVYLPIPITLSLSWALIEFVKAFGSAFIVSKIYNWK